MPELIKIFNSFPKPAKAVFFNSAKTSAARILNSDKTCFLQCFYMLGDLGPAYLKGFINGIIVTPTFDSKKIIYRLLGSPIDGKTSSLTLIPAGFLNP